MKKKKFIIKINKSPKLKKRTLFKIKNANRNLNLCKNKTLIKSSSIKILVNVKNLNEWKKKNGLIKKDKVYIIKAKLNDMRLALDKRGWIENPNIYSNCFNFKWFSNGYNKDEMDYWNSYQIINRFEDCSYLTKKTELIKTLENCIWFDSINIENILPETLIIKKCNKQVNYYLKKIFINYKVRANIYKLYKQNNLSLDENLYLFLNIFIFLKIYFENQILYYYPKFEIITNLEEDLLLNNDNKINIRKLYNNIKLPKQIKTNIPIFNSLFNLNLENNSIINFIKNDINNIKILNSLIGDNNIWILKPGALSRGRGIEIKNDYKEIKEFLDYNKETEYIIQKYIEKPFIIHKRKFDIRWWVLITSFDPLVVWVFEEFYLKFCSEEYNKEDLGNKFIHLTNNSINKFSKKKDCPILKGNMWFKEDFSNFLKEKYNDESVFQELEKKIYFLITTSVKSAKNNIIHRKSSFEIYGYDIMIDKFLNPWLIEVNLSPSMDKNTHVTSKLVPILCEDIIKVIIDHKSRPFPKIGNFKLLYKEKLISQNLKKNFNSINYFIESKKIKNFDNI